MSPKIKCHQNLNVTKTEMSPKKNFLKIKIKIQILTLIALPDAPEQQTQIQHRQTNIYRSDQGALKVLFNEYFTV